MFCLSFGGSANPQAWCGFSEMLCNLSNAISLMKDWDRDLLYSPRQSEFPMPDFIEDSVPYPKA